MSTAFRHDPHTILHSRKRGVFVRYADQTTMWWPLGLYLEHKEQAMGDRDDGWLPADEKLTPERAVRHIPLAPFDNQSGSQRRSGSKDDRINADAYYFVKIHGEWHFGQFSEEWYGWSFDNWGTSGIQLDLIEDLYEFDIEVLGE